MPKEIARLTLPKAVMRRLESSGVYCQTWVTVERQARSDRWVLRGVESGGSTKEIGRYVSFFSPDGGRLAWLQKLDRVGANGVHAVVIGPELMSIEMARINRLVKYGVKPDHIMVFMLVGYWPAETQEDRDYRRRRLREFGARPYPMPYYRTSELVGFQRWVVGAYDKRISWADWSQNHFRPEGLKESPSESFCEEDIVSKYSELTTVLTEERYLVEALQELGFAPEVCREGTALVGYMGDARPEKAHIIIRRRQLDSASNDIGFARDGNGVYQALISEYDRGIGFNDAWLGRLAQAYKERQTMAVAKAKGYVFKGREVITTPQGKKVQLRFAVR